MTVVVLLYDGVQMLDVTGPIDAFASANAFGADYRITHASLTGEDVVASSGARHGADAAVADLPEHVGTLLVPGSPNWQASICDAALVDAIRGLSPAQQSHGLDLRRGLSPGGDGTPGRPSGGHALEAGPPARRTLPRRRRRRRGALRHRRSLHHVGGRHRGHRPDAVADRARLRLRRWRSTSHGTSSSSWRGRAISPSSACDSTRCPPPTRSFATPWTPSPPIPVATTL